MAQVQSDDPHALGELYERYARQAYRVAMSVCQAQNRAEDAVQEAFVSIWHSRASYQPIRGTVAAWLMTVVRHRAIDAARRNDKHASRRAGEESLMNYPASDDVAARASDRAEADRLRSLLDQLPDAQREVITLAFYGELTHTEIAQHLDLPAGTVKGRMRLGLEKLRTGVTNDRLA